MTYDEKFKATSFFLCFAVILTLDSQNKKNYPLILMLMIHFFRITVKCEEPLRGRVERSRSWRDSNLGCYEGGSLYTIIYEPLLFISVAFLGR